MSREYRAGSALYAKPDKRKPQGKYDTRNDAYRLYQHDRPNRQQAHYDSHYVYDNRGDHRQPSGHDHRRPAAQQEHFNAQYAYDNRQLQAGGQQQARFVAAQQDLDGRYAAPARQDHFNHEYGQVHDHQHGHFLSANRMYPVQANFYRNGAPGATPHPRAFKDYSRNPLQDLFEPPEGYKETHKAEVHAEAAGADKAANHPPGAPVPVAHTHPPAQAAEQHDDQDRRKPRKVREYRIRKHRGDRAGGNDSDSDSDVDKRDRRPRKDKSPERLPRKDKSPERRPENWYTQNHPHKYIKLGDITYIRARTHEKKWIEGLTSAFESFGFVCIGVIYKGGDALLKVIAPIAAIKAYTTLLSPVLQSLVSGVTAGVMKK